MKNNIKIICSLILFALSISLKSQTNYNEKWDEVLNFEENALPQSAKKVIDEIYNLADKENNEEQLIKAIFHQIKYNTQLEESGIVSSIEKVDSEIKSAKFANRKNISPFLHLALSSLYKTYYEQNGYKINGRSTISNYETSSFETWDKNTFTFNIIKNANLALTDNLKTIKTSEFPEFFYEVDNESNNLPTMYDVVANLILTNIFQENYYYNYNSNEQLSDENLLSDTENFTKITINNAERSYLYSSICVYQKWLSLRLEDKNNREALIACDLNRLDFLKNKFPDLDHYHELWLNQIKNIKSIYESYPEVVLINNKLAEYYIELGNSYNFLSNPGHDAAEAKEKALAIIEKSIEAFPNAKHTDYSKKLLETIHSKYVNFNVENFVNVNRAFPILIEHKNVDKLYLSIYECSHQEYEEIKAFYEVDNSKLINKIKKFKLVSNEVIDFNKTHNDYNTHSSKYLINPQKAGSYLLLLNESNELSTNNSEIFYQFVQVTDLSIVSRPSKNPNRYDYYLVNNMNGVGIEGAKISFFVEVWDRKGAVKKKEAEIITDKEGLINIPSKTNNYWRQYEIEIEHEGQKTYNEMSFNHFIQDKEKEKITRYYSNIFTDRAIYRPGQTIHFKAISYSVSDEGNKIAANLPLTIKLFDVNWQEVSNMNLVTNEFGSCSGDFVLPSSVLTGQFTIEASYQRFNSHNYIKVEEYKRPNFEITTNPIAKEYKFNDNVELNGSVKSYSGVGLSDAQISYTVTRSSSYSKWYWWWIPTDQPVTIASGKTTSDNSGNYTIKFKAIADNKNLNNSNILYNYEVNITATDINGETHETSETIRLSKVGLILETENDNIIVKENAKDFKILAQNIAGQDIPSNVEIIVMSLFTPQMPLRSSNLGQIDYPLYSEFDWYQKYPGNIYKFEDRLENFSAKNIVYKTTINTKDKKSFLPENISKWESGAYRITSKTTDSEGNIINDTFEFILISSKDTLMPYTKTNFFYCDKTNAQPGDIVNLKIGSAYKDVKAHFSLFYKGEKIKEEVINISGNVKNIEIPISEAYYGGISFNVMFVHDGRLYDYSNNIGVEYEHKKLHFKSLTIRDLTVKPGQTIVGAVSIVDKDSIPADAEFLANMYDASLDVFAKNYWNFWMYSYYRSYIGNSISLSTLSSERHIIKYPKYISYVTYNNPRLNLLDIINGIYYYTKNVHRSPMMAFDETVTASGESTVAVAEAEEQFAQSGAEKKEKLDDITGNKDKAEGLLGGLDADGRTDNQNNIRSNFSENAFFYPNLRTNKDGKIEFTFTMPDALTRWNFMGLAHTKDLKIGQISASLITQKELMTTANLPRFLRENDKITISTKISNLTENKIKGKAKIELYDYESFDNLNNIFKIENSEIDFTADSNSNVSVSWEIQVPEGLSTVGIRITAESDKHIDGEEHLLPILSDKILVTEAIQMPVNKAGTKEFKFLSFENNKSNTLQSKKFVLEYTSNPAWYAILALPYLMEYPYECNEQTFSRFYANSLAAHIANNDPKIRNVFDMWKANPDSKALMSNLEKNQELKNVLLEESPWMQNGNNESQRKEKLGILFDKNRISVESKATLKKLESNQNNDGGWSWFKGNYESSQFITQHIVAGFGHLSKLGVDLKSSNTNCDRMITNAISFIDDELLDTYNYLKKHYTKKELEEDHLGTSIIHYLYARSFYKDIAIPAKMNEAFNYFKKQCENYWTYKSFYEKGMIALSLHRFDNSKISENIVASLKENAMRNEEMGMYWKYSTGYFWYEAPIETQALLIETFSEIDPVANLSDVEEMKIWLIKQKQTQDWRTTKATVEAVSALMLQGNNLLATTDYPIITVGKETIDVKNDKDINKEAGTGYFQKSWSGKEISKNFGKISVKKKENSASWGAAYWQYVEKFDKINSFKETPLKIDKKLFVERTAEDGKNKVIIPIEKDKLSVGDKVTVRIEISVDRDMEYVHLKDLRAACFEPVDFISSYKWSEGLGYYQSIKDASMNFFIDRLNKGVYVFEYQLLVTQKGDFSNGITTMQSMYAPEFTSHSQGQRIVIE